MLIVLQDVLFMMLYGMGMDGELYYGVLVDLI